MKKFLINNLLIMITIFSMYACVEKQTYPSPLTGLQISPVYMNSDETNRTLLIDADLSRSVLWEAIDTATNMQALWVKEIKLSNGKIDIKLEENTTILDRCAQVVLTTDPNRTDLDDTSLRVIFKIVQRKNKMFDGLNISELVMPYTASDTIIDLGRILQDAVNLKVMGIDDDNVSWCKTSIISSILKLHVDNYKSAGVRQALIRMIPKNASTLTADSLLANFAFLVTQHQNPVFEKFPSDTVITLKWNQVGDTLFFDKPLTGIKYVMTDSVTNVAPKWLQTTVDEKNNWVILKPQVNNARFTNKATVTLYLPNNGTIIDTTTVHTTFVVRQLRNDLFDNNNVKNRTLAWDQQKDTIKPNFDLTNVKYILTDATTQKAPTWLKLAKDGKELIVSADKLTNKENRAAKITLFMSNTNTVDSTCAQYVFTVTQKHNDIFDSLKIENRKLVWDQKTDTLKFEHSLKDIKCQVTDNTTHNNATWLKADVREKENIVVLTSNVLNSKKDRSAKVLLYLPNGSNIESSTVKTSFNIEQQHYTIFDNKKINDRTIEYNQTADTLHYGTELKNIRCQIIDNETLQGAKWVSGKVSGKNVIFTSAVNNAFNARSATVTLYLLDGTNVESSTIKTSFKLTQNYRTQIKIKEKSVDVDYTQQSIDLHVTSNAKYQVKLPGTWVDYILKPIDENNEIITLNFSENKTNEKHIGDLKLLVSGEELAKIPLTQTTNPKIEINFEDNRKSMSFAKEGGEFNLPIKTLTPDYKINKKGTWVSIGAKSTSGIDQYYHKITIPYFSGNAFERRDTITISNFKETVTFPILQHKYIYLNEAEHEVEEGQSFVLVAKTNTGRTITWKTDKESIATVDNGIVSTIDKGTTERELKASGPEAAPKVRITASIGNYMGVDDYNDYCTVTVFIASDKVNIVRGGGDYQKANDMVTANCPIVITNNYSSTITLSSLGIDGQFNINVKDDDNAYIKIKKGESRTFNIPSKLVNVYKPVISASFVVNNKTYKKRVYY